MDLIIRIDLLIYAILIDIIIIMHIKTKAFKEDYSSKLFLHVVIAIAFVSGLEVLTWVFGEKSNTNHIYINYSSNAFFLTLTGFPAALGLKYIDYMIFSNKYKCKRRFLIYLIPTYVNVSFLILNIFYNGFYFKIDSLNQYSRGIGVSITLMILYIFIMIVLIWMYKYKQLISGRITQAILVFFFFPIIGVLLQMLAYGTTIGMPFYTLSIFAIFLLLEKDELGKDKLTKLYTRTNLEKRIEYKLSKNDPFSIIMIDINDFKKINDEFGHLEGDRVLVKIASILKETINIADTAYRYGGDEFIILIESYENECENIISKIDDALSIINNYTKNYDLSLSYGYECVIEPSSFTIEKLLHGVDIKMYKDKANKKKKTIINIYM